MFCPKNDAVDTIVAEGRKRGALASIAAIIAVSIAAIIVTSVFGGCSGGVTVKDSTEDYTWEELSKISEEIAKAPDENSAVEVAKKYNLTTEDGKLDGNQTKSVTLANGMQTSVQIAGFAHDEKTDGGKAGITFIFKDIIGEHCMNSSYTNSGGWEKSQMRSYLNSEGLNLLPSDLKQVVISVNKLTNNVGETQSISSITSTSDQLWLFSSIELYGASDPFGGSDAAYNDVLDAEGAEYKLFRDMSVNSTGSDIDDYVKNYRGQSDYWWMRSPCPRDSRFMCVASVGYFDYSGTGAGVSNGICPGFCI